MRPISDTDKLDLSSTNEITQMTKFHCLGRHAFKAYLYHTKYLLTNVNREHPMDCRQNASSSQLNSGDLYVLARQTQYCFCSRPMGRRLMLQQTDPNSPERRI